MSASRKKSSTPRTIRSSNASHRTLSTRTEGRYRTAAVRFRGSDLGALLETWRYIRLHPPFHDLVMDAYARASREGFRLAYEILISRTQKVALDVALRIAAETGIPLREVLSEAQDVLLDIAPRVRRGKWSYMRALHVRLKSEVVSRLCSMDAHGITFDRPQQRREFGGAISFTRARRLERRGRLHLDPAVTPSSPEEDVMRTERRDLLDHRVCTLHAREAKIVSLHFGLEGDPVPLEDIASRLGVTRERVRQILERALRRLREDPAAAVLRDYWPQRNRSVSSLSEHAAQCARWSMSPRWNHPWRRRSLDRRAVVGPR